MVCRRRSLRVGLRAGVSIASHPGPIRGAVLVHAATADTATGPSSWLTAKYVFDDDTPTGTGSRSVALTNAIDAAGGERKMIPLGDGEMGSRPVSSRMGGSRRVVLCLAVGAAFGTVGVIPFLAGAYVFHQDVLARMGLVPVDPTHNDGVWPSVFLVVIVLSVLAPWALTTRRVVRHSARKAALVLVSALGLIAPSVLLALRNI